MLKDVVIYCDGFMQSNKEVGGGCSVKFVVNGKSFVTGKFYFSTVRHNGLREYLATIPHTNNVSEYFAMLIALYNAETFSGNNDNCKVVVYSDSQLIVNQINGVFVCNSEHLIPIYNMCRVIYNRMDKRLVILWVTRTKIVEEVGH